MAQQQKIEILPRNAAVERQGYRFAGWERSVWQVCWSCGEAQGFCIPNRRQDSTNRKIFRAALTIGLVSTVAKGGAVFKDLVIAHTFGRSDALDAFLIAFLLPSFVLALVMSSLGLALIPVLVETKKSGELRPSRSCSPA